MFHSLTIHSVTRETADSVAITFDIPQDHTGEFAFLPGQYLTLRADVKGDDIRRSYSIAEGTDATMTVGVKHVEDGAFSTFAQDLAAGDTVQVMPPEGRFTCDEIGPVVLIAAGSGITPMVAIAADVLARGDEVTLIYGNRRTENIMFRAALGNLKDKYLDKFTLIHILSREEQDVDLLNGRVTGAKIATLADADAVDLAGAKGIYICGPGDMIDDVAQMLDTRGIDKSAVHFERFFQDGEVQRAPRSEQATAAAQAGVAVEVILDGTRRDFSFSNDDSSLIDAAARQGIELPFSCKGGMCCTCRCKVSEGSAEMAVNYSLEQWELDAGFTLACQTRPTSSKLVLDFDAV
ncbi:MAG: 2Fe-2S iron-sulfur cluster-binding protein [Rhodobacterales bacterium]|nr:2Fe-2S iron-sulfur cluster-binding protein [Rhodobacterales bacterium]